MIPDMTNPPDPGKETQVVDVKGRSIVVKELVDAQLLILAREARLASNPETEGGRRMTAVARILDILETAIVQESDKEYVLDLATMGKLEMKDMLDFLTVFTGEDEKPKVRRGRPSAKRS